MQTLREVIKDAEAKKVAVGHFNISDTEGLWAIFNAARELKVPVVIGTSEGERSFIGPRQAVALVKSLREEFDYPIYINADHSYSFDKVKEAIDVGYDMVIFDGTKLPLEENIKITKQCVEYAKSKDTNILVEAELGYIGTSSKVLDEIPAGAEITPEKLVTPEDGKAFVDATGVDLFAPAVGNLHGMLKGTNNPALDIKRIIEIREATGVPLVLHGGSGITDEDFKAAIKAGISMVHINTEIRVAYRDALKMSLQENPEEVAPYRIMKGGVQAMSSVVLERLKLFNNM